MLLRWRCEALDWRERGLKCRVEEVWGLLLLMVRGLMSLKLWRLLELLQVLRLLLLLVLQLRGRLVVENLLCYWLNCFDGLSRSMRRREKAAGLSIVMRGR